jgi:hypothetical protein
MGPGGSGLIFVALRDQLARREALAVAVLVRRVPPDRRAFLDLLGLLDRKVRRDRKGLRELVLRNTTTTAPGMRVTTSATTGDKP